MKRILIATIMLISSFSMASAEFMITGFNVGVSGTAGVFHAEGQEVISNTAGTAKRTNNEDATAGVGFGSIFIEKTLPGAASRMAIGLDYVPSSLSSETAQNNRNDKTTAAAQAFTAVTNEIKLDFDDLTTLYLTLNVTDGLYLKAGVMQVDVKTKETLGTGSTYKDFTLNGSMGAVGYNHNFDNGMFARAEASYMDFENKSLVSDTNSDNSISMNSLVGGAARLSIGKSF